ncbi:ankyrin repeat domain-containing protein [Rhizobium sp. TRM95796]|uniref:ankyrin repeat domain-containing protein n=1 Tax=Rhizobium sp. TRM95796 TaxID=2979862 RepID=UPI0021E74C83|nr:ankyrin repeat domain-containing protein [Rhizobium sp. TRM95796]MCV3764908.1 ankyrin repeat domain-containing protein [Rhizobium sp. TRM95796]
MLPETLADAVCSGNTVAVIRHLESGADPNAKELGWSYEGIPLFLQFDNTGCQKPMGVMIRQILIHYGADIHQSTSSGYTLLMLAVSENNLADTRYLLENGLNPNAQYRDGSTALMVAAQLDNTDIAQLLIDYGAAPKLRTKDRQTASDFTHDRASKEREAKPDSGWSH